MRKNTALLGVDVQNDFTRPSGALFVPGADNDVLRMSTFFEQCGAYIDYVALTLDSHQPIHIANQCYWKDIEGYPPALFTEIKADEVEAGLWQPQFNTNLALDYLKKIEQQGEVCKIWPPHCVLGSWGWAVDEAFIGALSRWAIAYNKKYDLYYKGTHQATEHYSIFKAAVEYNENYETKLNRKLLHILTSFERVVIVGEAADYCVAASLLDMIREMPVLAEKTIVLTDCMSWIIPENEKATEIFDIATQCGVRFMTSMEFKEVMV